ncbi:MULTISPECIES: hypothetical protein [unclassified Butyrivibrio]|uniref:hypothetical protein n=1 Tax=unclassified Butyrivibrio TaxID=2639466 RepID=UPI0003B32B72|nr:MULTISPECIES: hypothetical protein [unclassified Butyrivibrio]
MCKTSRKSEDYRAAARMCRDEGHSEDRVLAICGMLCNGYREKFQGANNTPHKKMTDGQTKESKLGCRDTFLYAFEKSVEESMKVHSELIDNLIELAWFKPQIDKILDRVKDFRWKDHGYVYKRILELTYFDEEYRPNNVIYDMIGIGKTEYYAKRDIAIIVFGMQMWIYCKKRQIEDMDKGRIPWKDIPKGYDDLTKLVPIEEL